MEGETPPSIGRLHSRYDYLSSSLCILYSPIGKQSIQLVGGYIPPVDNITRWCSDYITTAAHNWAAIGTWCHRITSFLCIICI